VLVADFFVSHQLAINDLYCGLKFQSILVPDAKFLKWESFHEALESSTRLIPDGYFEILTPEKTLAAFLEVDLGHEGLSVWKSKIQSYLQYAVSGSFETRFKSPQFRVLVIANTERRMHVLRTATLGLTQKIFWFSTLELVMRDGFWSPVWLRAKGEERRCLLYKIQ
jgi:hypothetical protein